MTRRSRIGALALAAIGIIVGWILFFGLPRWYRSEPAAPAGDAAAATQPVASRKIKATLFYISQDGLRLVAMEREVPYGEGSAEQARRIIEEQLKDAPAPLVSALPAGTTLRALYLTERGDAFVDLSREAAALHTGGSLDELLTVYAIVNALTVNLPAVSAVQILIEGQEVDTLTGHVDLRRPLQKNMKWVEETKPAAGN